MFLPNEKQPAARDESHDGLGAPECTWHPTTRRPQVTARAPRASSPFAAKPVSLRRVEVGRTRAGLPNRKSSLPVRVYPGNGALVDAPVPLRPGPQATDKDSSYKARASQARRVANGPATGISR
jgi:hypothetical protein